MVRNFSKSAGSKRAHGHAGIVKRFRHGLELYRHGVRHRSEGGYAESGRAVAMLIERAKSIVPSFPPACDVFATGRTGQSG